VSFEVSERDLRYIHPDFSDVADAGRFDVWIAPSATGGTAATFALV
jgi:beta-glucosidase